VTMKGVMWRGLYWGSIVVFSNFIDFDELAKAIVCVSQKQDYAFRSRGPMNG
jgi:hypothetical protein